MSDKRSVDDLVKKYPMILGSFRGNGRYGNVVSVEDGWYDILDFLCGGLMRDYSQAVYELEWVKKIGVGNERWTNGSKVTENEIALAEAKVEAAFAAIPRAVQVKEKFGGLRFYVDNATPEQYAAISFAEQLSTRVCEVCGSPGKIISGGWLRTLCENHSGEQADKASS